MARLSTRTMNEWKQWILWARTTELLSVMVWVLGLWLFPVLFCSSPLKCRVLIFTSFVLFPLFSPVCLRLSVFCSSVPFPRVSWVWVSVVPRVPACITSSSLVCTLLSFCCSLFLNLFHTCCVFFFFFLLPAFMFLAFWLLDFQFLIYVDQALFSSVLPECLMFWSLFVKTSHWGNHPVLLQLSGAW